jgi:MFS family permease
MSSTVAKAKASLPLPPAYFRWAVLLLASLAMAGNYYVYDSISPLADLLRERLAFTDAQIGWLNAIYSLPNLIMVVIGGLIIDRIGSRKSTIIFGTLCFAGALLTASTGNFYVMVAGRLLFGLGAESLIVAVTTALAKWFRGKELSFAFGLNLTIARAGSFFALNSPTWARSWYTDWQPPLIIAVGIGSLCIIGAVLYFGMEVRAERKYRLGDAAEPDKVNLSALWLALTVAGGAGLGALVSHYALGTSTDIGTTIGGAVGAVAGILVFGRAFPFGISYWYVVALCVTFYSAMFPFQTFAVKFFMDAHGISREGGGGLSSMLTAFAMICTPLFGLLVDRVGKRSLFMLFGSLLIIPVYLIMAYVPMRPGGDLDLLVFTLPRSGLILPMAMMGISFSLIPAVMWPSVAYLVDQSKLGTGLGLMTMIQNVGLAGFNLLIGWANTHWAGSPENPAGYAPGMWMFSSLGLCAVFFAFLLRRSETGPNARGLETITTKSQQEASASAQATAAPDGGEDEDF